MAESKASNKDNGAITQPAAQERTLGLRLKPVDNSDQPVMANSSTVHLSPGIAYIDFGFIEPGVLAALPRLAQQGGKLPEQIDGKLAVRVAMGFDGIASLQQQLTRVMSDLTKAANAAQAQAKAS